MLLTTAQAAQKLGKKAVTIRKHIASGKLPATRVGRDWLIDEEDLDLIRNLKRGPKPKKNNPGEEG